MSKIGNFEGIENPEAGKSSKSLDAPSVPTENDRKKLDVSQPAASSEGKKPSDIKDMSDREKIAYYRKNGMDSLADNRNAIMRGNEGNGENQRLTKLNSHNYDKLAQARGLDPESAKGTKESFAKWSPEAKPGTETSDESLRNHSVLTRHASEGEKARITGNNDGSNRSGNYVSKGFPETAEKRKDDYALPIGNKAEIVKPVELARSQNIVVGQTGPQRQYKENPNGTIAYIWRDKDGIERGEGDKEFDSTDTQGWFRGQDGIPRTGGGRQIVTDGGFGGRDVNGDGVKEPALRYTENNGNTTDNKEK